MPKRETINCEGCGKKLVVMHDEKKLPDDIICDGCGKTTSFELEDVEKMVRESIEKDLLKGLEGAFDVNM
jgi:transcription elongation factor Elf1